MKKQTLIILKIRHYCWQNTFSNIIIIIHHVIQIIRFHSSLPLIITSYIMKFMLKNKNKQKKISNNKMTPLTTQNQSLKTCAWSSGCRIITFIFHSFHVFIGTVTQLYVHAGGVNITSEHTTVIWLVYLHLLGIAWNWATLRCPMKLLGYKKTWQLQSAERTDNY